MTQRTAVSSLACEPMPATPPARRSAGSILRGADWARRLTAACGLLAIGVGAVGCTTSSMDMSCAAHAQRQQIATIEAELAARYGEQLVIRAQSDSIRQRLASSYGPPADDPSAQFDQVASAEPIDATPKKRSLLDRMLRRESAPTEGEPYGRGGFFRKRFGKKSDTGIASTKDVAETTRTAAVDVTDAGRIATVDPTQRQAAIRQTAGQQQPGQPRPGQPRATQSTRPQLKNYAALFSAPQAGGTARPTQTAAAPPRPATTRAGQPAVTAATRPQSGPTVSTGSTQLAPNFGAGLAKLKQDVMKEEEEARSAFADMLGEIEAEKQVVANSAQQAAGNLAPAAAESFEDFMAAEFGAPASPSRPKSEPKPAPTEGDPFGMFAQSDATTQKPAATGGGESGSVKLPSLPGKPVVSNQEAMAANRKPVETTDVFGQEMTTTSADDELFAKPTITPPKQTPAKPSFEESFGATAEPATPAVTPAAPAQPSPWGMTLSPKRPTAARAATFGDRSPSFDFPSDRERIAQDRAEQARQSQPSFPSAEQAAPTIEADPFGSIGPIEPVWRAVPDDGADSVESTSTSPQASTSWPATVDFGADFGGESVPADVATGDPSADAMPEWARPSVELPDDDELAYAGGGSYEEPASFDELPSLPGWDEAPGFGADSPAPPSETSPSEAIVYSDLVPEVSMATSLPVQTAAAPSAIVSTSFAPTDEADGNSSMIGFFLAGLLAVLAFFSFRSRPVEA